MKPPQETRIEHSAGSPFGNIQLHPPNEPPRVVVANRKNRRYLAKLRRAAISAMKRRERFRAERKAS